MNDFECINLEFFNYFIAGKSHNTFEDYEKMMNKSLDNLVSQK